MAGDVGAPADLRGACGASTGRSRLFLECGTRLGGGCPVLPLPPSLPGPGAALPAAVAERLPPARAGGRGSPARFGLASGLSCAPPWTPQCRQKL